MTARRVPGPAPMPILGPLGNLLKFARDPIGYAGRLFSTYGPLAAVVDAPVCMSIPNGQALLVCTGAELNRQVLTQQDRFHSYALSGRYFPEGSTSPRLEPQKRLFTGLFHVNGDEHRRHRQLLMPSFHKHRIDAYRDDMVHMVGKMLETWKPGQTLDLSQEMLQLAMRIVTRTLFGDDAGEFGFRIVSMMQRWLSSLYSPATFLRWDLPGFPYRRFIELGHQIDAAMSEFIRRKRAQAGAGRDMLSMLIAARDEKGGQLSDDDLVGHVGVIFAAGYETTGNSLAWTLFLLSQHPRIAAELVEELQGALHGEAPTTEELGRLPLLDAVVKESLRVLPPVPIHPRHTLAPCQLAGYDLPAGAEICLSIYHLHHDPALFSAPQSFLPSRWTNIKPSPFEYNPFSAGPRTCIGAAFATLEIKIALAMILQRFRIAPLLGRAVHHRTTITLAPKAGLRSTLHRQDQAWQTAAGGIRGSIHELVDLPQ